MENAKRLIFKVLSIICITLSIFALGWAAYVKWAFDNGMDIAYVYRQLASQLAVATFFWIVSTVFHYLNGERKSGFQILQTVATGIFALMFTMHMVSISISYYGNWLTLKWYPIW